MVAGLRVVPQDLHFVGGTISAVADNVSTPPVAGVGAPAADHISTTMTQWFSTQLTILGTHRANVTALTTATGTRVQHSAAAYAGQEGDNNSLLGGGPAGPGTAPTAGP